MISKIKKNTTQDKKVKKAVDSSLKKYKKTYLLLDQYDKSPDTTPSFEVEFESLRKTLRSLSK